MTPNPVRSVSAGLPACAAYSALAETASARPEVAAVGRPRRVSSFNLGIARLHDVQRRSRHRVTARRTLSATYHAPYYQSPARGATMGLHDGCWLSTHTGVRVRRLRAHLHVSCCKQCDLVHAGEMVAQRLQHATLPLRLLLQFIQVLREQIPDAMRWFEFQRQHTVR